MARVVRKKSGGKVLTGILCFILGFIFAVGVEIALIAGGISLLLGADIDTIFSTLGVDNYDEENDKNIYINTNVEEGGVQKLTDLLNALKGFADKGVTNLTIGEVSNLVPMVDGAVDKVYSSLSASLSDMGFTQEDIEDVISKDGLYNTPVSGMGALLKDGIYNIKVEAVMRVANIDVETGSVYLTIAYGREAATAVYGGRTQILWSDALILGEDGAYVRESDGKTLPEEYNGYVVEQNSEYFIYYLPAEEGCYLATYDAETDTYSVGTQEYGFYDGAVAEKSGGYYYEGEQLVVDNYRRLKDLIGEENALFSVFDDVYVTELFKTEDEDSARIMQEMFGGVTLGEFLRQEVAVDDLLDNATLPLFVDVPVDNTVLMYISYGITDIYSVTDQPYQYTGTLHFYDSDGNETGSSSARVYTDGSGNVDYVEYREGDEWVKYAGTNVGNLSGVYMNVLDNVYMSDFIDISVDDGLMMYIGYAITDVVADENNLYDYTGTIHLFDEEGNEAGTTEGYISVNENGVVDDVYVNTPEGLLAIYRGVSVNDINGVMNTATDNVCLKDFIEISADNNLMVYVGYGLTGLEAVEGEDYTHTATLSVYDKSGNLAISPKPKAYVTVDADTNLITSIYYMNGDSKVYYNGVTINGVSALLNNFQTDLTIADVVEIDENSHPILKKLGAYTIAGISDGIDSLALSDAVNDVSAEDALMAYLVYGLKDVTAADGAGGYAYTGSYVSAAADGQDYETVYITADANGIITGVYQDEQLTVKLGGTGINDVNNRINGLKGDLTIGAILGDDGSAGSNLVLDALRDSTIDSLDGDINNLTLQQLFAEDIYGEGATIMRAEEQTFSTDYIYYEDAEGKIPVGGTGKLTGGWSAEYASYYTYGGTDGVWSLLLYSDEGERLYTINDVGMLQSNVIGNLQSATLYEFENMGVISADAGVLDRTFGTGGKRIGDMTLSEFIAAFGEMGIGQ